MTKIPVPVRASAAVGDPVATQYPGVYQGSVVQINDPLNLGRVRLYVPQVLGTAVSNWAMPTGISNLDGPVVNNQIVNVWFLGGNRNIPIYSPASWTQSSVSVSTPSIVFGTPVTNTNSVPVMVTVSGGTLTNITINGTATGLTSGSFTLYAGGTILLTGSGATWHWFRAV